MHAQLLGTKGKYLNYNVYKGIFEHVGTLNYHFYYLSLHKYLVKFSLDATILNIRACREYSVKNNIKSREKESFIFEKLGQD